MDIGRRRFDALSRRAVRHSALDFHPVATHHCPGQPARRAIARRGEKNESRNSAILRLARPVRALNSVYERARTVFSIMDQPGYDQSGWPDITSRATLLPSVHMMGTMAAARTKRLRIGMAVSLAPFYNRCASPRRSRPGRVFGGRVNWGAGAASSEAIRCLRIPARKVLPASTRRSILSCGPGPNQRTHLPGQVLPIRRG